MNANSERSKPGRGTVPPGAGDVGSRVATPVIIDTDPGIDDAIAILLALASPELDVLGLTTVAGNTTLHNTTANAIRVLDLAGRHDIPVAAGADRPLIRTPWHAEDVHGADGLGGADLPAAQRQPIRTHAVDFIAGQLHASPVPVTLITIGPLTNIALLLALHPAAASRIGHVVMMGGSTGAGNITPTAEFNIWFDPEAAHRVFASNLPKTIVGLDVARQAIVRSEDLTRLQAGGRVGQLVTGLVDYYSRYYQERHGTPDTCQHDALTVAHLIRPELVTTRRLNVTVEYGSDETRGTTVIGEPLITGAAAHAAVAFELDAVAFTELLLDRLSALDAHVG
jgi:pyrimidine-specific ribonucleoside hydrolase